MSPEPTRNPLIQAIQSTGENIAQWWKGTLQKGEQLWQQGIEVSKRATLPAVGIPSVGVVGLSLEQALAELPKTAAALAEEMPRLYNRLRLGAGHRSGEAPRTDAEIMQLFWQRIPGSSHLEASERELRVFLSDKHGSHIISRHHGGSHHPDNILFEFGAWNLARGSRDMSLSEQMVVRVYNGVDSVIQNSGTIARLGISATLTSALTYGCVTAIAYSLDLSRGEITPEQFRDKVLQASAEAGLSAIIFFPILLGVIALLPEVTVLLTLPAVAVGFNLLLGVGILSPLVDSMRRHWEAGGFDDWLGSLGKQLSGETDTLDTLRID